MLRCTSLTRFLCHKRCSLSYVTRYICKISQVHGLSYLYRHTPSSLLAFSLLPIISRGFCTFHEFPAKCGTAIPDTVGRRQRYLGSPILQRSLESACGSFLYFSSSASVLMTMPFQPQAAPLARIQARRELIRPYSSLCLVYFGGEGQQNRILVRQRGLLLHRRQSPFDNPVLHCRCLQ